MWYFVIYSSTTTKAFNGLWISVSSVLGLGLGAQGGAGAGTTLQFRIRVSGEQGDRYRPGSTGEPSTVRRLAYRAS